MPNSPIFFLCLSFYLKGCLIFCWIGGVFKALGERLYVWTDRNPPVISLHYPLNYPLPSLIPLPHTT